MIRKPLGLVGNGKYLINPLPYPSNPLPIIAPNKPGSCVAKINQVQINDELPGVNAINKLLPIDFLMSPHNIVEVPYDKRR